MRHDAMRAEAKSLSDATTLANNARGFLILCGAHINDSSRSTDSNSIVGLQDTNLEKARQVNC